MVIGFDYPKEIGFKGTGLVVKDKQIFANQPFVVIRQSTYEEWKKQFIEEGGRPEDILRGTSFCYFYEIQTD